MRFVAALSGALGRLLLTLVLTSQVATLTPTPLAAAELPVGATLSIIAAPVEIAANGSDVFAAATQGQLVEPGDVVRTGSGGLAVLTFFDGSESQLAADSQIQLQRADYAPAPNIALTQTAGVTVNRVIPLPPGGSFETDTPTAIGLVRGTSYVVSVAPASPEADAAPVSSMVLLTDRDGHVGHVQVSASGSSAMVDLTHAGDVGATAGHTAAAAHLAPAALVEMEQSARDLYDGQSAQVSAVHARGVVDALAPVLAISVPAEKSAAAAATELADAPKVIDGSPVSAPPMEDSAMANTIKASTASGAPAATPPVAANDVKEHGDMAPSDHAESSSNDSARARRPDDSSEPPQVASRPARGDDDGNGRAPSSAGGPAGAKLSTPSTSTVTTTRSNAVSSPVPTSRATSPGTSPTNSKG